jgi:hypothetical protein
MDPHTGVLPGLKVMVDRATRWKFAWQQSPLAACPQEVKDGVEDGTKVGGARSPARTSRRQNRGNPGPCRVGQVGVVEWLNSNKGTKCEIGRRPLQRASESNPPIHREGSIR